MAEDETILTRAEEKEKLELMAKENPAEVANVANTWKLMISKRYLKIEPVIVLSGLSVGIMAALFVPLMTYTMAAKPWTDEKKSQEALLSLVSLGIG